jgi:phosphate starvation-inducible protein PhoH
MAQTAWDPNNISYLPSKKKQRKARKEYQQRQQDMKIKNFYPITGNQQLVFDHYDKDKHLILHGVAGTGKTFVSLYLALSDVMDHIDGLETVTIVRSVVPSRDMGFLPGDKQEKESVYEAPYISICAELFGRSDAYETLKQRGAIEFISTSHIRGITLSNTIVIVDETQNLNFGELDTIITRLGENCRIMLCGDYRQTDFSTNKERGGLKKFLDICSEMKEFDRVEFVEKDIVRSPFVRSYLISKLKAGIV